MYCDFGLCLRLVVLLGSCVVVVLLFVLARYVVVGLLIRGFALLW